MNNLFGSEEGPKGRNSWPGSWTPESFVPNTHLSRWCPITPWSLPFFELEENCFTMLCWFLPYSNTNNHDRTYICIVMKCVCVYIPSPVSLPPQSHPLGRHRASSWAPCAIQQRLTKLSVLHVVMNIYVNAPLSVRSTLSFPCCGHKSVLHVCISIPSLQIGSSVLFS